MPWPDYLPRPSQYTPKLVDRINHNGVHLDAWFNHDELIVYITQDCMRDYIELLAGIAHPVEDLAVEQSTADFERARL